MVSNVKWNGKTKVLMDWESGGEPKVNNNKMYP